MKISLMKFKRNIIPALLLSAFGLATTGLIPSVIAAQTKTPPSKAETKPITATKTAEALPLEGVVLTLRRKPEGTVVESTTSDSQGKFEFHAVPPGAYYVTLSHGKTATPAQGKPASQEITTCVVIIEGGKDRQPHTFGWDFKSNQSFSLTPQLTARSAASKNYSDLESNGFDPLHGSCNSAIVKSKSNIRNN